MIGPLVAAGILVVGTPTTVFAAGTVACLVAAILVARLPVPERTAAIVDEGAGPAIVRSRPSTTASLPASGPSRARAIPVSSSGSSPSGW